jgi:hypothetical protein
LELKRTTGCRYLEIFRIKELLVPDISKISKNLWVL